MRLRFLSLRAGVPLCLLLLTGCVRWQEVGQPGPALSLARARVELRDGRTVSVDNLVTNADSLTGVIPNSSSPGQPLLRFAAHRDEVTSVYERQGSLGRTFAAVILPVVAVLGSIYLLGY